MQFQYENILNTMPFRLLLMTIVRNWKPSSTRNKLILCLSSLFLNPVAERQCGPYEYCGA